MALTDFFPYCIADRYYYDSPAHLVDHSTILEPARRPVPKGWTVTGEGLYKTWRPDAESMPDQGWKIHVSATPDNSNGTVATVWDYCIQRILPFKFLRSRGAVWAFNSKSWPRSSSGKVATIYPPNEAVFLTTLLELDEVLGGQPGPYILSDARFALGPLYFRYGAFKAFYLETVDGNRALAIRKPDGDLIQDNRLPIFSLPSFVQVPEQLKNCIRDRGGELNIPYTFDRAITASNSGGIYFGHTHRGQPVVIKEARPLSGLDNLEHDAQTRLRNEQEVLTQLQELNCVPRVIDYLKCWEHDYLVLSYIDGQTLLDEIIHRYPLVHPDPTVESIRQYLNWVIDIFEKLRHTLLQIHSKGVTIGDLHPNNIVISPECLPVFVDFEAAAVSGRTNTASVIGAPGFAAPSTLSATEADDYSLRRTFLMCLLPIVPVTTLDGSKLLTMLELSRELLGADDIERYDQILSSTFESDVARGKVESTGEPTSDVDQLDKSAKYLYDASTNEGGWPALRDALIAAIERTVSLDRTDRLIPGDPSQFTHGGGTFAYGAAGVIYALHSLGHAVQPAYVRWLETSLHSREACPGEGFYNGPHGIAFTLDCLGRAEVAHEIVCDSLARDMPIGLGLFSGQSGIALNLLQLGKKFDDHRLRLRALEIGQRVAGVIFDDDSRAPIGPAGLFDGWSGPALLLLRLFEETSDIRFLDAAEVALRRDLLSGQFLEDGVFHLARGSRNLIYLDGGSIGVALVMSRFMQHRQAPEFESVLKGVRLGCRIPFVIQPGLFQGRAGMIAMLADGERTPEDVRMAHWHVRHLALHAVWHGGGITFPGSALVRLSSDFATGAAGIALALNDLFSASKFSLPFLQ